MIGGVFIVIMITTAITYSAMSMNQITQAAEIVETKQTTDFRKQLRNLKL